MAILNLWQQGSIFEPTPRFRFFLFGATDHPEAWQLTMGNAGKAASRSLSNHGATGFASRPNHRTPPLFGVRPRKVGDPAGLFPPAFRHRRFSLATLEAGEADAKFRELRRGLFDDSARRWSPQKKNVSKARWFEQLLPILRGFCIKPWVKHENLSKVSRCIHEAINPWSELQVVVQL